MSRWLVNQGDRQITVSDLAELKKMAQGGKLNGGDMVQPPGASDWLYAAELPELKGLLQGGRRKSEDDEDELPKANRTPALIAVLAVLLAGAGYAFYHFANKLPEAQNLVLLGEGGLALTEMLVTSNPAVLRPEPKDGGTSAGSIPKDSKIQLLAKRGGFYQVEFNGSRGWVKVDDVIPAYYFADKDTRENYDPIYNPDRYVFVRNASWMQMPDQRRDNITVFNLELANKSRFDMTDALLLATIKDKNGKVLETAEVPVEGVIKSFGETMLGTLAPPEGDKTTPPRLMTQSSFDELAKDDEELHLRWSPGIEVKLKTEGFVEANIDLLQVRAVPKKL